MGSPRALLSTLPKGFEFQPVTFRLTPDEVDAYLDAVGDRNAVYRATGLAPPLAVAARALGALLHVLELPDGTLHAGQEVDTLAGVPLESELSLAGRVAQRSERGGVALCVIEFTVALAGAGESLLRGRTTVMAPLPASQENGA
jgi:hypothetical protein